MPHVWLISASRKQTQSSMIPSPLPLAFRAFPQALIHLLLLALLFSPLEHLLVSFSHPYLLLSSITLPSFSSSIISGSIQNKLYSDIYAVDEQVCACLLHTIQKGRGVCVC